MEQWQRKAVVDAFNEFERFHHAGLTANGCHCLVASDNEDYAVIDVETGDWLWTDVNDSSSVLPEIVAATTDGWFNLLQGPVPGKYRIFGLHSNHPIERAVPFGISLQIDLDAAKLILRDIDTGNAVESLAFEQGSGDWAYASFSDDCSTIAVLEPYYVTLFRAQAVAS